MGTPTRTTGGWKTWLLAGAVLGALAGCKKTAPGEDHAPATVAAPADGAVRIIVNAQGYEPSRVATQAGKPLKLVFRRTADVGCGDQVVFPTQNIKKDLPLNQDVEVTITPQETKEIAFTCGMGMYKGAIVVAGS